MLKGFALFFTKCICLMIIGNVTGGITLHPIILGVINGSGTIDKYWKDEKL